MYYYVCKDGFLALTNSTDNPDFTSITQKEFEALLIEAQEKEAR